MTTLQLPPGAVDYLDTGGDGPVLVLLHGLLMDATLWGAVTARLQSDHRCIVPTLPLGAHRQPMHDDADLSLVGVARLVDQLCRRLRLSRVTLVGVDTGGALVQLLLRDRPAWVAAVVLVSCEAFDNVPPGLTGKTLVLSGRLPGPLFALFVQQLRVKAVRRLPLAFGWLTKYGDPVTKEWLRPLLRRPEIRRDTRRVLRAIDADRTVLLDAAPGLRGFAAPALVVWARGDRVMPPLHGRRLAELLPQGRYVEVDDTATLVPLDQPDRLADLLRSFTADP